MGRVRGVELQICSWEYLIPYGAVWVYWHCRYMGWLDEALSCGSSNIRCCVLKEWCDVVSSSYLTLISVWQLARVTRAEPWLPQFSTLRLCRLIIFEVTVRSLRPFRYNHDLEMQLLCDLLASIRSINGNSFMILLLENKSKWIKKKYAHIRIFLYYFLFVYYKSIL